MMGITKRLHEVAISNEQCTAFFTLPAWSFPLTIRHRTRLLLQRGIMTYSLRMKTVDRVQLIQLVLKTHTIQDACLERFHHHCEHRRRIRIDEDR